MSQVSRVDSHIAARLAALGLVVAGVMAGAAQVLVFRELLVVCHGTELTVGLILASWLVFGAIGSLYGRRLGRQDESLEPTAARVAMLAIWPGLSLFVGLILIRCAPWLLTELLSSVLAPLAALGPKGQGLVRLIVLQPGEMLSLFHIIIVAGAGAFLPAALEGCQFAAASRLYVQARSQEPVSAGGRAYAYDSVGHLLGGVALAWIALRLLDPFTAAAVGGLLNLAVAAALLYYCCQRSRPAGLAAVGIISVLLLVLAMPLASWSLRVRWWGYQVLENVNSIYGNIVVVRHGERGVCFFQNGVPVATAPPVPTVQIPVHFAMTQARTPRRVLLIGGAMTGALQELLKYEGVQIDCLELDPRTFEIARRWLPPDQVAHLDDPQVNCVTGDARLFVKRHAADEKAVPYDVVLVMLSGPSSAQLNRFYTLEWFQEVSRLLAPDGVVCWQVPSSDAYLSGPLLLLNKSSHATATSVLGPPALLPGSTSLLMAAGGPSAELTEDFDEVYRRLTQHRVRANLFEQQAYAQLVPFNLDTFRQRLRQGPPAALNLDARPIGFFYHQSWWFQHFHHGSARLLERLAAIGVPQVLLVIVCVFAVWSLLCLRPARFPSVVPGAIAVTGFVGMVAEVVILFTFQAYYGYVYHQIGFIVGAFMVGIAIGALWIGGRLRETVGAPRLALWMGWLQLAIAAVVALTPLVLSALWASAGSAAASLLSANAIFPLLTMLIGLLVGTQFPIASLLWATKRGGEAESVPLLFATDLIGAAAGALLGGALLVPVFGALATCLLMAATSALMTLLLATYVPFAE